MAEGSFAELSESRKLPWLLVVALLVGLLLWVSEKEHDNTTYCR